THHHRHIRLHLFQGSHNTLRHFITADDAAEDVEEHSFNVGIRKDDAQGSGHALCGRVATDIQEVSRLTTVELNDVHGGHGQPSAVHHTANFAIQLDVAQTIGPRLTLSRRL